MGLDYALVHLKFTIPLASVLSIAARPLLSRLDLARIAFIITVAVTATIPWDSYLIRTGVWTYPEDAVVGFSVYQIPAEELFFFFIQTYITALLYIICNKPVLHAQYLTTPETRPAWIKRGQLLGQLILASLTIGGGYLVAQNGDGTYMGLILAWACPFALITWTMTGDMILAMPWTSTLAPIMLPTMFLWYVDELSLRSGVWSIETGTKLGSTLFGSLELEEAVFFLVTNTLIVFGIAAFDKAVAVCDVFPQLFPEPADSLPISSLLRARVTPTSAYDVKRIEGLREAVTRLQKKSRSFYLASSVFPGRLRIDLTLLYSYCRLADDLVDNASSPAEALKWVSRLREFLNLRYSEAEPAVVRDYIRSHFDESAWSALELLPTRALSSEPLYSLLAGFETDLEFKTTRSWPIHDEPDLELYASRVASTIGELCLDLVFEHTGHRDNKDLLFAAAKEMGIALQYVNIARDIAVDAQISRVYLPTTWLNEEGLSPEAVLLRPYGEPIERMRRRLLGKAFHKYRESRRPMELLPREARGPMTVAVESYMEIGRVLSEGKFRSEGKATVPAWRRLGVVWKTLRSG
ncbi:hypothetical protein S40285_02443 [Stachybotrys chlorohalonatus IBT 40285]|uniref:Bifunctional lycopene cyclase/phytoene synthase n=1 Tax=Stachybotrys chlorohalonatus (strain IBT 40285) TaxID=1283841 RepID=A0A084R0Q2_STAC4|nr:hypothetical protein S40285_02443 [Stachybotrys chlorohalonata IBT 40285]